MARPKIGLALGSGSARGLSHIGVIEALHEGGIRPDIICGCSIGAMIGAAHVADRLDHLRDWVLALKWQEIAARLGIGLPSGGLVNGDVFSEILTELGIDGKIEDYATPFAAVATSLRTGREIWIREGPVQQAARASMALPGIFSPAQHGDEWLLDGGLVNPVPVSVCRALGADVVIAVNLNSELVGRRLKSMQSSELARPATKTVLEDFLKKVPASIRAGVTSIAPQLMTSRAPEPGYFDVLANSINIMQDQITRARLAGDPPHLMLLPRVAHMGLFEFDRAEEAIEQGRIAAQAAFPQLEALLESG